MKSLIWFFKCLDIIYMSHAATDSPFTPLTNARLIPETTEGRIIKRQVSRMNLVKIREILYQNTYLGEKINDETAFKLVVDFYNKLIPNESLELEPSVLTFSGLQPLICKKMGFESRTGAEGVFAGQSAQNQCLSSIPTPVIETLEDLNEPWNTNNFKEWECKNCWLCGLPLRYGGNSKFAALPPLSEDVATDDILKSVGEYGVMNRAAPSIECEHKLPFLLLGLFAAGLKYTPSSRGGVQVSGPGKKAVSESPDLVLNLPRKWKYLCRAEGYAWSHKYCNQLKLQMPFITLRPTINEKDEVNYVYIIEVNNIRQYLRWIYGPLALTDMNKIGMGHRDYKENREANSTSKMQYKNGLKYKIPNWNWVEDDWEEDKPPKETPGYYWTKEEALEENNKNAEKAFKNIINMLIPLLLLLNTGSDILEGAKIMRDSFLGTRSFIYEGEMIDPIAPILGKTEALDNVPILKRLEDNLLRMRGWAGRRDSEEIEITTPQQRGAYEFFQLINNNIAGLRDGDWVPPNLEDTWKIIAKLFMGPEILDEIEESDFVINDVNLNEFIHNYFDAEEEDPDSSFFENWFKNGFPRNLYLKACSLARRNCPNRMLIKWDAFWELAPIKRITNTTMLQANTIAGLAAIGYGAYLVYKKEGGRRKTKKKRRKKRTKRKKRKRKKKTRRKKRRTRKKK